MKRLAVSLGGSIVTALMLTGSAVAAQAPPAAQEKPAVFRAAADVVSVDASVQRDRRPVTGLKAADFELLDNGVAQEITDVAYEKLPIDVTVLLDVSASVTGPVLDELGRALRQVRADLLPGDRLRLLTFNMSVRRLVDFGQPAPDVDQALASMRGVGSSAIFDGLAVALSSFDAPGRRRLVAALQRRSGQQQHHRRRHAARRRETNHSDRRDHPRVAESRSAPHRCSADPPPRPARRLARSRSALPAKPAVSWRR